MTVPTGNKEKSNTMSFEFVPIVFIMQQVKDAIDEWTLVNHWKQPKICSPWWTKHNIIAEPSMVICGN